jgi:hypothetical protein
LYRQEKLLRAADSVAGTALDSIAKLDSTGAIVLIGTLTWVALASAAVFERTAAEFARLGGHPEPLPAQMCFT